MEGNHVSAALYKVIQIAQRFADHQMNVKDTVKILADTFHNRSTKGNVWNEMSVHNIDVQPWSTSLLHFACFFSKICKISRENGRRNLYHKVTSPF